MLEINIIHQFQEIAIPHLEPSTGWKDVPIQENGERLIAINNLNKELILVDPQYAKQQIPHSLSIMYLRESVANRLLKAARLLPQGYKLLVWDAWRPLEVQQSLFGEFKNRLHAENPNWDEEKLVAETQTYVSLPSTNLMRPSPHNTGGSIDLTVCDSHNKPLPMGVEFDYFGPEAATDFYERKTTTNSHNIVFRNNRRLLYHIMNYVEISSYNEEFWHFDFGNQFDAVRTKKPHAVYGQANLGGDKQ